MKQVIFSNLQTNLVIHQESEVRYFNDFFFYNKATGQSQLQPQQDYQEPHVDPTWSKSIGHIYLALKVKYLSPQEEKLATFPSCC